MIADIIENFDFLDDWDDRYRYLIELGRTLAPLSEAAHNDVNKVRGCTSQVWLETTIDKSGPEPVLPEWAERGFGKCISICYCKRVEATMRAFDHIGIPTNQEQPGEMYVAATKVWVTDPELHPQRIEYLRFEPDSPVTGPVRDLPHTAFRVEALEEAIGSDPVLLGPFQATDTVRVVFVLKDGAVFEFMESSVPGHWFRP